MNPLWLYLGFVTAIGACVGSFLNVVIYRLPAGVSLVSPPSTCPKCGNRLAAYDNVPVLGWFWLRGKCRSCKDPIAFQYPVVEAVTAAVFASLFMAYYVWPTNSLFGTTGVVEGDIRLIALYETWPTYVVHAVLAASLIAATMIDARLFIIPLSIPLVAALVALVVLPLAALWFPGTAEPVNAVDRPGAGSWTVTTPSPEVDGKRVLMVAGGLVGLVIANVLLWTRVLPRGFDVPDADESKNEGSKQADTAAESASPEGEGSSGSSHTKVKKGKQSKAKTGAPRGVKLVLGLTIAIIVCLLIGKPIAVVLAASLLWWGMLLHGASDEDYEAEVEQAAIGPEGWVMPEHPRREMVKEGLFVALPTVGAIAGAMLWGSYESQATMPMAGPVRVAAGVVMGFLAGGAVIWGIRIFGTVLFNKEAMGLGDVHLMAAVGAVIGWVDVTIACVLAAFAGIVHTAIVFGLGSLVKQRTAAIPFGPHLCGATILVMLFRDHIAHVFFLITHVRI